MTDRDALYRAILAHPDDDTPRLVYADWLEENGRAEEAEFIRVECRLEAGHPDDPDHVELLRSAGGIAAVARGARHRSGGEAARPTAG